MPEETNRIWVYHITGRRLSGAVKWPNIFFSNRQDAGPKIDPKRKNLWMSADPF